uniref:Transmembrane protein n=1 Tax=Parastrongyloides trichosuri TaxID=131310 RepID=A0A0N4ZCQ8_PARTI
MVTDDFFISDLNFLEDRPNSELSDIDDSFEPGALYNAKRYSSSDELDKLSMCLSEASSEQEQKKKTSLASDIIQAQLALWTLVFSIFYSYAWQQHRKKFLMTIIFVVPTVVIVCCGISILLTNIIILGRLFTNTLSFEDILNNHRNELIEEEKCKEVKRKRTYSVDSCNSSVSSYASINTERDSLPTPSCIKHSSLTSLNYGPGTNSMDKNPSYYSNNGTTSRKLSYTATHYTCDDTTDMPKNN